MKRAAVARSGRPGWAAAGCPREARTSSSTRRERASSGQPGRRRLRHMQPAELDAAANRAGGG